MTDAELAAARDFLIGVFPLRFETPGPIVGALRGWSSTICRTTSWRRYRARIEAVSADDVLTAAEAHIDLERLAAVMVGDAAAIAGSLETAGFGPVEIERDDGPEPTDVKTSEPAAADLRAEGDDAR